VGTEGIIPASISVDAGGIVLASFSVGAGGIVPESFLVGVLVPSSNPSSARSIKIPLTLLSSFSYSFPLVDGIRSGSILLLSGDGGGTDIPWLAGSTDGEMVRSRLA